MYINKTTNQPINQPINQLMGGGILPTTIHKGKLYFLFGKEGKYEDTAPGFSDFGGGTDKKESFLNTAIRESAEELTGFLGGIEDVRKLVTQHGTFVVDHVPEGFDAYRTHIFPFEYNEWLPFYYNNNQRFLQKHLPPKVFKTTKIFEKAEIRWICEDDLEKMMPQYRFWFKNIVQQIIQEKDQIKQFISQGLRKSIVNSGRSSRKSSRRSSGRTFKSTRRHQTTSTKRR